MATSISNTAPKTGLQTFASTLGIGPSQGALGKLIYPNQQPAATTAPLAPVKTPQTSGLIQTPPASTGGASYKGVAITPGNEAAQVAAIDARTTTPAPQQATMSALMTPNDGHSVGTQLPGMPGFTPPPATATTPTKGLFSSVVSSLANPQTDPMTTQGMTDYQKSVSDLAQFRQNEASTVQGIYSAPTSARVMQGRSNAIQTANAQKENALSQAVTQAQQEVGYGQAQQGLNQSAETSAAGLAAPQQNYPFVFDPTTGGYTNAATGGMVTAQDAAQALNAGQLSPSAALAAIQYLGTTAQSQLVSAMQQLNPSFNWNTAAGQAAGQQSVAQAPYSANASNIQTLGTATAGGQAAVLGTIPQLTSANTAADGIKGKIITYLSSNPSINSSNLAAGNTLNQWLQGKQLTDPKYQTLMNYLNEYTNTLAPVLGVGGDPTNLKTEIAARFVNAAASGQSIAEVLDNMQQLAAGKIQDIQSGATGGGVVSNPQTGSNPAGSNGSLQIKAADGNNYGFYQDANGQWHAS